MNNRPSNLEWCNQKHNVTHALASGLWYFPIKIRIHDITDDSVYDFNSLKDTSRFLNICSSKVLLLCKTHRSIPYLNRYLINLYDYKTYEHRKYSGNEREIAIKNYRDQSVSLYRSINSAVINIGVTKLSIVNNLGRYDRYGKDKMTNGYVFRSIERLLEPWPVYSPGDIALSISRWSRHLDQMARPDHYMVCVRNIDTNDVKKYNNLKLALKCNGIVGKYSTVKRHFKNNTEGIIIGRLQIFYPKVDWLISEQGY